jgi:hypothetical protein
MNCELCGRDELLTARLCESCVDMIQRLLEVGRSIVHELRTKRKAKR